MVTETIHRRDPTLAVFGAGSMDAALRSQPLLAIARVGAAVIASFGLLGLLLATVGLYGVVSQATAPRRQEFGIRTALGATPAAFTRLALGRGVVLTALGLALGAVAATAAGRVATGFLVDVRPGDPVVFAVVGFLLAGTALAAVSCHRGARQGPTRSGRCEPTRPARQLGEPEQQVEDHARNCSTATSTRTPPAPRRPGGAPLRDHPGPRRHPPARHQNTFGQLRAARVRGDIPRRAPARDRARGRRARPRTRCRVADGRAARRLNGEALQHPHTQPETVDRGVPRGAETSGSVNA